MTRTDARIRYALALFLALTALAPVWGLLPWWGGLVAGVLSIVMIVTATTRYCPVYTALGVQWPREEPDDKAA